MKRQVSLWIGARKKYSFHPPRFHRACPGLERKFDNYANARNPNLFFLEIAYRDFEEKKELRVGFARLVFKPASTGAGPVGGSKAVRSSSLWHLL